MPIYEYRCENGHVLEVMQRISEDPLTSCSTCGAPVQRVFHPVAVHFKGSGFYSTDYGKGGSKKPSENGSGGESQDSGKDSGKDSGSTGSKESKSSSGKGDSATGSKAGSASSD